MRLKAMTFNVRGVFHNDGVNAWEQRRALNVATIQKYAPDILGLQEAQTGNLETYAAALTDYNVELGPCSIREAPHNEYGPIYWRRDRFQKRDAGGFYLSATPDVESAAWGSHLVRAVNWVRLRDLASDVEFVVLNTHFPHELNLEASRVQSARLVIERLAAIAPATPQLVMADFNTVPGSDAYLVFAANGYTDTYRAAGHADPVNTFHGFQGPDFELVGVRIDWLLTRDDALAWTTHRCDILTDAELPVYPSDHYPVLAELELA